MSERPVRRSTRLSGYDYASGGAYFVTIVTAGRASLFARAEVAAVVQSVWAEIPLHSPGASIDQFVVMPNHVHGILVLDGRSSEAQHAAPLHGNGVRRGSLGAIVRSFKAEVTGRLHEGGFVEGPIWQRNYFDRIIRNEAELGRIREYIYNNPLKWDMDFENPIRQHNANHDRDWSWLERPQAATS